MARYVSILGASAFYVGFVVFCGNELFAAWRYVLASKAKPDTKPDTDTDPDTKEIPF